MRTYALLFPFLTAIALQWGVNRAVLINDTLLATSVNTCMSNFECPTDQYCSGADWYEALQKCVKRGHRGSNCQVRSDSCISGFVCADAPTKTVCLERLNDGDICKRNVYQCSEDLDCVKSQDGNFRCTMKLSAGSRCAYSNQCSSSQNLSCKMRKCTQKSAVGQSCTNYEQCESSICASSKKCAPRQKIGKLCLEDAHCVNSASPNTNGNHVYCNQGAIPSKHGRCLKDSQLIKELGANCSPKYDRCDSRRGLSCKWSPSDNRHVCQQRTVSGFCTPGSNYSKCESSFFSTRECYLAPDLGSYQEPTPRFYKCNPFRTKVPIGIVCNNYAVECPKGSQCTTIPGISQYIGGAVGAFPYRACVYVRGVGEKCENKFESKCQDGLKCENGKCIKGSSSSPETHANFGISCDSLPCVPGAECVKGTCQKRTKFVGLLQPCAPDALYNRVC